MALMWLWFGNLAVLGFWCFGFGYVVLLGCCAVGLMWGLVLWYATCWCCCVCVLGGA